MKHIWRTLMLTVAMVFALNPLRSQVVGISGVNVPLTPYSPVCSGEDFNVTFNYYWTGFPGNTGPQTIEITVPVPTGLIAATNSSAGGIYPGNGTVAYVGPASAPTSIIFTINADLTVPNGMGSVEVNLKFPAGVTCNRATKCFTASSRYRLNNVWSTSVTSTATGCVEAKATNNWNIKKDVMWCKWDTAGRSILYRVTVQNNTPGNNWDPTCSINIPSYTLTDQIPSGASFGGIVLAPPGFTPSSWTGIVPLTNSFNFTGGPSTLNVASRYYYVYYWVRYPNSTFGSGPVSVPNKIILGGLDTCANKVDRSDSLRANLCAYSNTGALTKSFTQILGTPPNPSYFPSLSPGCCGSYTLVYKNTGTVDQPNLITIDRIPDNVDFNTIRTVITEPGMTCVVTFSTNNGASFPPGTNTIGNYTTVNTSGHLNTATIPIGATHIKWEYSGVALPVGYTLSNYIGFCVRNDYRITSPSQNNDANGNTLVDPGETIRNTATTTQNSVLLATVTNDLTISPFAPIIIAHKFFIGNCVGSSSSTNGPWWPGQTVRYRIAVANIGNTPATTCTITDLLPQYLSYAGAPTYAWYTATSIAGVDRNTPLCNITSTNPPTTAVGTIGTPNQTMIGNQQQVKWTFNSLPNDCDGFPTYLIIDFDVKISGPPDPLALAGNYCNKYDLSWQIPSPSSHQSNTVCFAVSATPQATAVKSVGPSANGPWSSSASIGAGQQGYYKIKIVNTGNTPLARFSLLDILPQLNDLSMLAFGSLSNYTNRNSRFDIALSGPVTPTGGSDLSIPGDMTPMYTPLPTGPLGGIKRSTVGLGFKFNGVVNLDPVGVPDASSPNSWTSTYTGAKAFKLESTLPGFSFMPGKNLEFTVQFTVPSSAPNDSVACNSFACQGKPQGLPSYNGGDIVTQTGPVCVTAIADSCDFLCNEDFEIFNGQVTDYMWLSQDSVPCWNTTASDSLIEIWNEVGMSVPAYSGTYFAELNATQVGTLYQTFTITSPKTVSVGFAHRGRYAAPDVMRVHLAPEGTAIDATTALANPSGGSIDYSDNNSGGNLAPYRDGWRYYTTVSRTIPAGTYRLSFESVSSGGPDDGGNFLDSITVHCAEPTTGDSDCECDSLSVVPGPTGWVPGEALKFTVHNKRSTAISWIDIQYYDCTGINPVQFASTDPLLFQLYGGYATLTRDIPVASLNEPNFYDWFSNVNKFQRLPKVGNLVSFGSPLSTYQHRVTFNIALPYLPTPLTWCVKLIVHHDNGDTCHLDFNNWSPQIPQNNGGGGAAPWTRGAIHAATFAIDWTRFPKRNLGFVTFSVEDSLDEIVGGSGGMIEGDPNVDTRSSVRSLVQSRRTAVFSVVQDSQRISPLTVFLATKNTTKKPKLIWSLHDENASVLSQGTIETSSTVSKIDPPIIAPGTNDVSINSIIPNPASGSVTFNYTLGASEAVRIELFDPLGKSVGVIADGFQTQGLHQLNYHVGTLAEGTYYLRLTTRFATTSAVVKVIH